MRQLCIEFVPIIDSSDISKLLNFQINTTILLVRDKLFLEQQL